MNNNLKKIFKNEAALIALIPLTGQLVLSIYSAGYFSFFNIPFTMLKFNFNDLMLSSSAILLFFWLVLTINNFFNTISEEFNEPYKSKVSLILFNILIGIIGYLLLPDNKLIISYIIIIFLSNIYSHFIAPIFKFKNKKNYIEKLSADNQIYEKEKKDAKKLGIPFFDTIKNIFGDYGLIVFFIFLCIFYLGRANAFRKSNYYITTIYNSNYALIWINNDSTILAPIDPETKTIFQQFKVFDSNNIGDLIFTKIDVGPLTSKQIENYQFLLPAETSIPTLTITPTISDTLSTEIISTPTQQTTSTLELNVVETTPSP